jgi:SAM-dependent methyltransferase
MNCPVCLTAGTVPHSFTGSDVFFETTKRTFGYRSCPSCHCLFIDPVPHERELEQFYPSHYWWKSSPALLTRLEFLYRRVALRDHIAFIDRATGMLSTRSRPIRLLDVGCGSGALLGLLVQKGFDVVGFDMSKEAAAIAKADHGVDVITGGRLQDGNFSSGAFDVVSLFHVVEHVSEPRDLLVEVRRLLHSRGRLVLQVPNIESWQFKMCGSSWHGLDAPRHVINYSNRAIRRLLSDSGFRVCRTRHFNLRDNAPALASSIFPSLDPIRRSVRQRRTNCPEPSLLRWARHAIYLGAVVAAYPFAIAESMAGSGATVMIEAEKA